MSFAENGCFTVVRFSVHSDCAQFSHVHYTVLVISKFPFVISIKEFFLRHRHICVWFKEFHTTLHWISIVSQQKVVWNVWNQSGFQVYTIHIDANVSLSQKELFNNKQFLPSPSIGPKLFYGYIDMDQRAKFSTENSFLDLSKPI